MFSRNGDKLESIIGVKSEFIGEINVQGTLRVDGHVNGKLNADSVVLSEAAQVKGDIIAKRVIIGGKMEGKIRAEELLEIKSKGKVRGEILANKFSVAEGGEFNGQIDMKREESKVIEFEARN